MRVAPDNPNNNDQRLELDPDREPVMRRLWALALDRPRASAPLARELNPAGLRTRSGAAWTRRRVQDTLSNAVYAGLLTRHRGTNHEVRQPGGFTAYVTLQQFEQVGHYARRRDRSARRRSPAGAPSRRFVLARSPRRST